jgi:16S rRNA (guanine(1405)-N(7))-methyltransferase
MSAPAGGEEPVEQVVRAVAASRRYRHVCSAAVRRLAGEALARSSGDPADATKRTKRSLHQAFGAFLPTPPRYDRLADELEGAVRQHGPTSEPVRELLRDALAQHHSTRERLPELGRFYAELFARVGPVESVLDLGCGLNPLAVCWMPSVVGSEAVYRGVELDARLVAFLGRALDALGVAHELRCGDLLGEFGGEKADLALLLKLVPTLEQQRAGSAAALIERTEATWVAVSLPTHSLGRRTTGLDQPYTQTLRALCSANGWALEELDFPGERLLLIRKSP